MDDGGEVAQARQLCASGAAIREVDLSAYGRYPALPGFSVCHRFLVVPMEASDGVVVYDLDANRVIGVIALAEGSRPWQAKVVPKTESLAYVTNSRFSGTAGESSRSPSTVSVIDFLALREIERIPVGAGPNGVTVDRLGRRGYVANMRSDCVSVIDAGRHVVVDTIKVGVSPAFVKLTPDGSRLLVTNLASSSVTIVDTASCAVVAEIVVGVPYLADSFPEWGAGDTTGVAVTENGLAFVTNYRSHSVCVLDMRTLELRRIGSPFRFPFFVEVDRINDRIIVSSGVEGVFSIFDIQTWSWGPVTRRDGEGDFDCLGDVNLWMTQPAENKIIGLLPRGVAGIKVWDNNIVAKFL